MSISSDLKATFGGIDIYLFDQLHRGRFDHCRSVLDAGCGSGRNLAYLLDNGLEVCGVDRDPAAIARVRLAATQRDPRLPTENFQVASIEDLPFEDTRFDAVIVSAVLHFADDEPHFRSMLDSLWRVLRPGGLFFSRLASTIGIEARLEQIAGRRYRLPDGSERFCVDEALLVEVTEALGGQLLDPIKTTNVQNQRCMTTWVLRKQA